MPEEKLTIEHLELLYPRFKKMRSPISEYSFSNLYLFRRIHDYKVIHDGDIFIKGVSYDKKNFLMPTEDLRSSDFGKLKKYLARADFLFPVPEEWLSIFNKEEFDVSSMDSESDYMYSTDKISSYRGSKLHKKRNLLKQFLALYKYEACPLTNERLSDARIILDAWQESTRESRDDNDYYACGEALELYEELILCGGIYYAQNQPAGFIIGEELNSETFVIQFAKANIKFKGIYQYMYNTFAKILPAKYKYLNFEQDMGKEALRIAKSSYLPDIMLKKYRVSLRANA
ncbi:MAG: hypothetical protein COV72_04880 [Candidatus Omnitrophica bacterium CG11_big_fil_rev_8_21_14_0_20_42_13]|uniref:Phosphatidylglycerol lysyltransferase C-terminal domain-containing protein n=1 Tax=Candidatus Ghiorseimicrobium undicola TaxID=1974746 RepID=A0A2H0LXH9_9BACT|nr:MAG: hypothetical protein COV72_04880 [Candidatus Omnitrophica bacterium CG11_big_fil_rev_8_21_14_0_20_42_13]